jgi:hypothetical protein
VAMRESSSSGVRVGWSSGNNSTHTYSPPR